MGVVSEILPQVNISDKGLMYLLRRYIPEAQIENLVYINSGISVLSMGTLTLQPSQFFIITNVWGRGLIQTLNVELFANNNATFNGYWITPDEITETLGVDTVVEWHLFEFING